MTILIVSGLLVFVLALFLSCSAGNSDGEWSFNHVLIISNRSSISLACGSAPLSFIGMLNLLYVSQVLH